MGKVGNAKKAIEVANYLKSIAFKYTILLYKGGDCGVSDATEPERRNMGLPDEGSGCLSWIFEPYGGQVELAYNFDGDSYISGIGQCNDNDLAKQCDPECSLMYATSRHINECVTVRYGVASYKFEKSVSLIFLFLVIGIILGIILFIYYQIQRRKTGEMFWFCRPNKKRRRRSPLSSTNNNSNTSSKKDNEETSDEENMSDDPKNPPSNSLPTKNSKQPVSTLPPPPSIPFPNLPPPPLINAASTGINSFSNSPYGSSSLYTPKVASLPNGKELLLPPYNTNKNPGFVRQISSKQNFIGGK